MKIYGVIIIYRDDTEDNPHRDVLACDISYKKAARAAKKISSGLRLCGNIALAELGVRSATISDNLCDRDVFDTDKLVRRNHEEAV